MAMGVTTEEDDMLMKWAAEGIIDDQSGQDKLYKIYQSRGDVSKRNIESIIAGYSYKPGAQELVEYIQIKGYQVVLISGAMDLLVSRVADQLDIAHWRASNKLVFDDQNKLQSIESPPDVDNYKVVQLEQLCRELGGVSLDKVVVVGDGDSDKALFEVAGWSITFEGSPIADRASDLVGSLQDIKNLL